MRKVGNIERNLKKREREREQSIAPRSRGALLGGGRIQFNNRKMKITGIEHFDDYNGIQCRLAHNDDDCAFDDVDDDDKCTHDDNDDAGVVVFNVGACNQSDMKEGDHVTEPFHL